jgi:hypothetical protein
MRIHYSRERAIQMVIGGFMKKLANFDNELLFNGNTFMMKDESKWVPVSIEEAHAHIDKRLEEWAMEDALINLLEVNIGQCPKCRKPNILDALSRRDNKTGICNDCGTAEAMEDLMGSL